MHKVSNSHFSRRRVVIIALLSCIFVVCLGAVCWFTLSPGHIEDVLKVPALQTTLEADTVPKEQQTQEQESAANEIAQNDDAQSDAASSADAPAASSKENSVEISAAKRNEISIQVTIDGSLGGGSIQSYTLSLQSGTTAYDALLATGVSVNARPTGYGTYVAAIDGIAENAGSGWVYAINGVEPNTTCSNYVLSDGDTMVWTYVNVS